MKPLLPLSFFMLSLCACSHFAGSGDAITSPAQLTESSLYNIDSVRAVADAGNEEAAKKKFMAAIDIYKNVKDPAKSIDLFKSSIRLHPSAKAYFELGSALLDDGRYDESINALHIAEQLEYSPLANVMYKLVAGYSHRKNPGDSIPSSTDDSLALHYMEVAIQMGYAHPEQFHDMGLFSHLKNLHEFTSLYNNARSGNGGSKNNPDKMLWESFKAEFHSVELPLTINTVWIQNHKLENSIGYDYEKFVPEMRDAKFSREVEDEYYYFATIKKDTGYTTLLYAGKNNFLTDANQNSPVFFLLSTYDKNGKIIDKMRVAGQRNFTEVFKVFRLQPNYTFEIRDYKNIFKNDPEQVGYDSNYVVKSEPLGIATYRIGSDGKFEKTDVPLAMR